MPGSLWQLPHGIADILAFCVAHAGTDTNTDRQPGLVGAVIDANHPGTDRGAHAHLPRRAGQPGGLRRLRPERLGLRWTCPRALPGSLRQLRADGCAVRRPYDTEPDAVAHACAHNPESDPGADPCAYQHVQQHRGPSRGV